MGVRSKSSILEWDFLLETIQLLGYPHDDGSPRFFCRWQLKSIAANWWSSPWDRKLKLNGTNAAPSSPKRSPIWGFPYMGDPPKWLVYNGTSYCKGWFRVTPISGNFRMFCVVLMIKKVYRKKMCERHLAFGAWSTWSILCWFCWLQG